MKQWILRSGVFLGLAAMAGAQTVLTTQQGFGMDDGAITPNGALAVVRENSAQTKARVHSTATGQLLATAIGSTGTFSGAAQDAVEVTDTRAVVLGSSILVLDLTNLASPLLAEHTAGYELRDVAITPDGTTAVVRGGNTFGPFPGGLRVVDLASGSLTFSHPGEIGDSNPPDYTYSVDSVVATDDYGVCLSLIGSGPTAQTRVTIVRLHPQGGGNPVVAYETAGSAVPNMDQLGAPHDLCLVAGGQYVAVRSEASVSLYSLGSTPARVWHHRLWSQPGPMGLTSMDSIEATGQFIATASRFQSGTLFGAQLDLFDLAGNQWHSRVTGDPHDLVFTPDGSRLLVRTHRYLYLFTTQGLPPAPAALTPSASDAELSTNTFYGAGYDSLQATDTHAVAVVRNSTSALVNFYRLGATTMQRFASGTLPEKPTDVELSPNGRWVGVSGTSRVQVYDFEAGALALQHDPYIDPIGWYPWCDGIELDNDYLVAWGYGDAQAGWVSLVDLFSSADSYCTAGLNSTGQSVHIRATGSGSLSRNNLRLWASGLPAGSIGYYAYSVGQQSAPLGNGTLCLAGQRYFMPLQLEQNGVAMRAVQYGGSVTLGGAISAGSTWNFQYRYRDPAAGVAQFNLSDAVSIPFVP
ncbi:MAG: hypothetical protein NTV21_12640 [Planctomycetota bacterium]|nr:hypothetical protein [Planctomycetota bacterium]